MEYQITWSPEAVEDLESIAKYIERDSPYYAQSVVSRVLELSRKIQEFPFIGRVVPEIGDEDIRERFIYSYRLVYKIQPQSILVLAVIHGKRLIEHVETRL